MTTDVTLAGIYRPAPRNSALVYDGALIGIGSLMIATLAQLALWLPFSPVPVTGQTLGVLLAGLLLGSRRGSLTVLAYIAEGAAGLPVFASGRAGVGILFGPTGGYLLGFVLAAFVAGLLAERKWDRSVFKTAAAMVIATACIYVTGLIWLSLFTGVGAALVTGFYPFVCGAIAKMMIASALLPGCWKLLGKTNS